MSFVSDAFLGGVAGIGEAIGNLALKIREAITGKSVLDSKDQIALLSLANEMDRLKLQADAALIQGQLEINKAEAASTSLFKGGWRPGVGWICAFGLAYTILLRPILPWALTVAGIKGVPLLPEVDMDTILAILGGILGLGGMRTYERVRGKA